MSHYTLPYHDGTAWENVAQMAEKYPRQTVCEFMGTRISFGQFARMVRQCANALVQSGVKPGDRVTLCLPNCPHAVILFYGVNLAGGVANMVHPLSAEEEIAQFLRTADSRLAFTLDLFYDKFRTIAPRFPDLRIVVASAADFLRPLTRLGYALTEGRKIKLPPFDDRTVRWKPWFRTGRGALPEFPARTKEDPAAILYTGGTTGIAKGAVLSNFNLNALALQILTTNPMFTPGDKMLAILPLFHGFGLGIGVHAMIASGGGCVLVPRFTPASFAKLLVKTKCAFLAGVPSLYESMLNQPVLQKADLSHLKGVYCGGDVLPVELKAKLDAFLAERGSPVHIREGYGATECSSASCLTPTHGERPGSIGLPLPDVQYKIVRPDTIEALPPDTPGEICISGPTVMPGYLDCPEENAIALRRHDDGQIWLHTGDLGSMDADGYVRFIQRIKRIIITNGYNVYPSRLELVLNAHPQVKQSCVIGVPDPRRMHRIKAFVVLQPGVTPSEELKKALTDWCRPRIARYALPRDIEFRDALPLTRMAKVDYRALEQEERAKLQK
jgi:long-chain acyl-CoA synthetase